MEDIYKVCPVGCILFYYVCMHGSDALSEFHRLHTTYSRMRDTAYLFCKGVGGNDYGLLNLQSTALLYTSGKSFVKNQCRWLVG
jgi:hypothetical protein